MSLFAAVRLLPAVVLPAAATTLVALALLLPAPLAAQAPAQAPTLTASQIVSNMTHQNQLRASRLAHYSSIRHYRVEYQGLAHLVGEMEVEATYDARKGKSFRILSETGSHALCEKVLKRAVESEREATHDQSSTALTPANYGFTLLGSEPIEGRMAYILRVEPISPSKFLYRGRVWVDAADFAVVKIDASPAKNPSFWISKTLILQSFARTGEFWLPARNRSETHVRVGGSAVFTIDYGSYRFEPAATVASSIALPLSGASH
jgi:hypothetical protein